MGPIQLIQGIELMNTKITKQLIEQAQQQWAEHLMAIGQVYLDQGDYRQRALDMLGACYGYHLSDQPVLFKPTRAAKIPFRGELSGALSYFVGGDDQYPEDHGFALDAWSKVTFRNHNFICQQHMGLVMGEYLFSKPGQQDALVEYTFGYVQDSKGELKIVLHHSSFPAKGA